MKHSRDGSRAPWIAVLQISVPPGEACRGRTCSRRAPQASLHRADGHSGNMVDTSSMFLAVLWRMLVSSTTSSACRGAGLDIISNDIHRLRLRMPSSRYVCCGPATCTLA